ncbi:beta-galactosidase domain 4-containing protein [Streptomyces sp. E-15]
MTDRGPAGPVGAGRQDDAATASGGRPAYGGERDERVRRDPGGPGPVGIRCHRPEGIVVVNHRRARGLAGLAATWELSLADGRTFTAPAELPDLRPGETAAVPLPRPLPLPLPADGGAVWLTLRVVTAEERPGAPRGTRVCAPRVRLRTEAGAARQAAGGRRSATAFGR